MNEEIVRPRIEAALKAVRAGEKIEKDLLEPVLGHRPSDEEVAAIVTQFERFDTWSLEDAVNTVMQFLQSRSEGDSPIKPLRESVDELFKAAEEDHDLSLRVRNAFGVVSRSHEKILKEAIKAERLSKKEALTLINDGRGLTRHLSGSNEVTLPLVFSTVDHNGMPQVMRDFDEVQFHDAVQIETAGDPFLLLLSNEIELRQGARPEGDTVKWLEDTIQSNSVLWDVGANVGFYSLYAASIDKTVKAICFEPGVLNIGRLNANIQANRLHGRVIAFPVAVSDVTELCTFGNSHFIAGGWSHRGISSKEDVEQSIDADVEKGNMSEEQALEARKKNEEVFASGCVMYSLDDFMKRAEFVAHPTHLKIDVDGPEMKVLRGATDCFRQPDLRHILIEMRDDEEAAEAQSILTDFGFQLVSPPMTGFGNRIFERRD